MAQYRRDRYEYLSNGNTIFEVVMLADQYGNMVGPANPSGTAVDAFGRARSSQPLTLFDSFSKNHESDKFITSNTAGGSTVYASQEGVLYLQVDGSQLNSEVIRESNRVFAYQPGKSLLAMNSFVFSPQLPGLRQRVGYFGKRNGVFVEQNDDGIHFVKRDGSNTPIGQIGDDTLAIQTSWNIDPLDGTGPSGLTLEPTKAQIFWTDIEWLGVGSVRCGFVINGQMIHCHTFHHANIIDNTYMGTAILPVRYEITVTQINGQFSNLKQICSTVISEGGYEFRGSGGFASRGLTKKSVGNSFVPLISIRLRANYLDDIAVIQGLQATGDAAGLYELQLVKGVSLTNANFNPVTSTGSVEYDIAATAYSGGEVLGGSVAEITNQSSLALDFGGSLFDLQLERDSEAAEATIYTLIARTDASAAAMSASFSWQEVT